MPCAACGIPVDAEWLGPYTDGMGRWARVTVTDPPPAKSPGMHTLPREHNASGVLGQTRIMSLRAKRGNLAPRAHTPCCQYIKDSSDSPREDFGRRACSSNNHPPSIILHQFPRDYAGTYYDHFGALGSVVALTDEDGYSGQLLHDERQVSRVDPGSLQRG